VLYFHGKILQELLVKINKFNQFVYTSTTCDTYTQRKFMRIIPERFIEARNNKGWSQEDCARELSTTQQSISNIEKGQTKTPKNLEKYARKLGVSVLWLIGESDTPNLVLTNTTLKHPVPLIPMNQIANWLKGSIVNNQDRITYMYISEEYVGKRLLAFPMSGNAMVSPSDPVNSLYPGTIAFLDPEAKPEINDYVVISVNEDVRLRILMEDGKDKVFCALNPQYPLILWDKKVEVLGVVLFTQKTIKKPERAV
jgi:transcriptional regulator with XRE-family HTH domain